jgi:hypothetical protein
MNSLLVISEMGTMHLAGWTRSSRGSRELYAMEQ